jgi:sigma-54 dependent transcriptional regulator, acetoin dehydrogenase operon transcriptional activator AcoR
MAVANRHLSAGVARPHESTRVPLPGHAESIEESHRRCAALGLKRIESPDFAPGLRADLSVARERNQRLSSHAAPIMELLSEQIRETQSMIVLTDALGTILHSVGDTDLMQRAGRVALAPGVNWAEQSKGTNAIGTALFEETATLVHASEHYMHANGFLTCSAAPIFDPRGNILGVLDVTGDEKSYHPHTMGLVRMSARMIENHWLAEDYRHRLRVHFHPRPEFVGTLMEGIVVVQADGRVLGGNRAALDLLSMSSAQLRMQSLVGLFGTTVSALVDHFRAPLALPLSAATLHGPLMHLVCRFEARWLERDAEGPASSAPTLHADTGASAPVASRPLPTPPNGVADQIRLPAASTSTDAAGAAAPALRVDATATPASNDPGLAYLLTGCPQMQAVVDKIRRIIDRDIPLLILGETGTGKELVARAVHRDSRRARQPFVAVNCASIPETLIEAELFGYEDGAFTGARRKGSVGRIVQAHGGTLFLDEIGDMPLALQARLLRVLQERQVTPLGSTKSVPVDVALVGATHRPLREMIERGQFREDLYYRLNGLTVKLPPLRERPDRLLVARRILAGLRPGGGLELADSVATRFAHYHWPGNIRQLSNVLRTAAVMAEGEARISEAHLSDDFIEDLQRCAPDSTLLSVPLTPLTPNPVLPSTEIALHAAASEGAGAGSTPAALPSPTQQANARTLDEVEIDTIRAALDAAGGNISVASRRLGVSRNTIYRKLRWNQA